MNYTCPDCHAEHEHPGYCVACLTLHRIAASDNCPWCHGQGAVERVMDYHGDPGRTEEVPCGECKGSGRAR